MGRWLRRSYTAPLQVDATQTAVARWPRRGGSRWRTFRSADLDSMVLPASVWVKSLCSWSMLDPSPLPHDPKYLNWQENSSVGGPESSRGSRPWSLRMGLFRISYG